MKHKFHIINYLLVSLLILSINIICFSLTAHAAESGTCGDSLTWSYSDGHLKITGSGEMTDFTDENMPPWYEFASEIKRVSIDQGVTDIGSLAFYECTGLKTVSLPSTLTEIGDRSFKNCTSIAHISFPASLRTIGEAAFENCAKLGNVRLPDGLQVIEDFAFYRCTGLTSIKVPSSVRVFGMVVFAYCDNLTQATIECSITNVPDWTFYGCEKLGAVALPSSVNGAGSLAFHECGNLETIYYSGDAVDELMADIREDEDSISSSGRIVENTHDGTGSKASSSISDDGKSTQSQHTTTKDTGNSLITKEVETDSTFSKDGQNVTIQDILESENVEDFEVESTDKTTITSTITHPEGWTELADEVKDALRGNDEDEKVIVNVYVQDPVVEGSELAEFSRQDVVLNVTTNQGDTWKIDASSISKKEVSDNEYDLSVSVTETKSGKTKIDSDTVYKVEFADDVDLRVTVGIHVGNAYELATLYEKHLTSYKELQTVVVDADGVAWFSFADISRRKDYYVGINVLGIKAEDAVIPETMYIEYSQDEELYTLTDAQGTAYKVGPRESSWGITGKQYAIYAALIIGGVILIVTLAMLTWNKLQKSKMKYAVKDEADSDDDDDLEPIDEEALRMEIMRELLGEKKE